MCGGAEASATPLIMGEENGLNFEALQRFAQEVEPLRNAVA